VSGSRGAAGFSTLAGANGLRAFLGFAIFGQAPNGFLGRAIRNSLRERFGGAKLTLAKQRVQQL
jgi:hypothetical protein